MLLCNHFLKVQNMLLAWLPWEHHTCMTYTSVFEPGLETQSSSLWSFNPRAALSHDPLHQTHLQLRVVLLLDFILHLAAHPVRWTLVCHAWSSLRRRAVNSIISSLIICAIFVLFLFQCEIVLCQKLLDMFNMYNACVLLCKDTKLPPVGGSFSLFYLSWNPLLLKQTFIHWN